MFQREHSNIITNLRATNEPLFTVTEHVPTITEVQDDSGDELSLRSRRKIERNISAPLPGMLQVGMLLLQTCWVGNKGRAQITGIIMLWIFANQASDPKAIQKCQYFYECTNSTLFQTPTWPPKVYRPTFWGSKTRVSCRTTFIVQQHKLTRLRSLKCDKWYFGYGLWSIDYS